MHKVIFTSTADKQLRKLTKPVQKLIVKKIKELDVSMHVNNNIKKLSGVHDLYRLRVGDYRAIYKIINEELIVLILKIGHRKDIYRNLNLTQRSQ
jgi:mRNA interferase RelE/StbE